MVLYNLSLLYIGWYYLVGDLIFIDVCFIWDSFFIIASIFILLYLIEVLIGWYYLVGDLILFILWRLSSHFVVYDFTTLGSEV